MPLRTCFLNTALHSLTVTTLNWNMSFWVAQRVTMPLRSSWVRSWAQVTFSVYLDFFLVFSHYPKSMQVGGLASLNFMSVWIWMPCSQYSRDRLKDGFTVTLTKVKHLLTMNESLVIFEHFNAAKLLFYFLLFIHTTFTLTLYVHRLSNLYAENWQSKLQNQSQAGSLEW